MSNPEQQQYETSTYDNDVWEIEQEIAENGYVQGSKIA